MGAYLGGVRPNNGDTINEVRAVRLFYFLKNSQHNDTDLDAVAVKMEDAVRSWPFLTCLGMTDTQMERFFYEQLPSTKWGEYFTAAIYHSRSIDHAMVSARDEQSLAMILQRRNARALMPYFMLTMALLTLFSILMMLQFSHDHYRLRVNRLTSKVSFVLRGLAQQTW